MKHVYKLVIVILLMVISKVDLYSQQASAVEWRTEILKQGPDTLRMSIQIRRTNGSQNFTLSSFTFRIRWTPDDFGSIKTMSSTGNAITTTKSLIHQKGYSVIKSKFKDGQDSIYQVVATSPFTINTNGWSSSAELIAAGDPDSGFTVTSGFREVCQINWLVLNSGSSPSFTIDDSPLNATARYNNFMNCPQNGGTTNLTTTNSDPGDIGALPVEIATFSANVIKNNAELKWVTNKEKNNKGFQIERKSSENDNSSWTEITFINGVGNSELQNNYKFTDKNLFTGSYQYRLKQIDFNGNYEYYTLKNEVVVGIPINFEVSQNYPNPFNPVTKIDYSLPTDGKVNLSVYDLTGREVRTIVNNEIQKAGYYSVTFDGSNLSSGMYFYRIISGSNVETRKMMLIK